PNPKHFHSPPPLSRPTPLSLSATPLHFFRQSPTPLSSSLPILPLSSLRQSAETRSDNSRQNQQLQPATTAVASPARSARRHRRLLSLSPFLSLLLLFYRTNSNNSRSGQQGRTATTSASSSIHWQPPADHHGAGGFLVFSHLFPLSRLPSALSLPSLFFFFRRGADAAPQATARTASQENSD
ncbi:hypothetical protein AABB24_033066, partial [Solanum stoloniferum]